MERRFINDNDLEYLMKKDKKRPHNFYIEDDIWEEFQIYCLRKKTTATKIISDYIKKLVSKNAKKKRKIR